MTTTLSQLAYGSAQIQGYTSRDRVGINTNIKLDEFYFFEIEAQRGFKKNMQGILGMSRVYNTGAYSSGPVFHEQLFNKGVIASNVFGVYLGDMDEESSI